jgi:hypothetical protein
MRIRPAAGLSASGGRNSDWRSSPLLPWRGPTLAQFTLEVERAFGGGRADRARELTGLGAGERASPAVLRRLCCQWGLPPEDFGLEPD